MEGSDKILNPDRPCDICGDVGWLDALMTCIICKGPHEHIYCMRKNLPETPEIWSCEACSRSEVMNRVQPPSNTRSEVMNRVQPPSKMKENLQTNLGLPPPRSTARSSRSARDYLKGVATGKVKYLAAEDVVKLSSGQTAIIAKMGSQASSSRNVNHSTLRMSEGSRRFSISPLPSEHTSVGRSSFSVPNRGRPSIEQPQVIKTPLQSHGGKPRMTSSDAEAHWSSPEKAVPSRGRPSIEQPRVIKTPLQSHGGKPRMTSSDAEAHRSTSEKPKVTEPIRKDKSGTRVAKSPLADGYVQREEESFYITPPPAGIPKHVIKSPVEKFVLPEEESVQISSPPAIGSSMRGSSSKDSEMLDILNNGLPDHISVKATWKGSFEIMGTLMDGSYEGLQAYPPQKVHVKAAKVFNTMPSHLQFELHPRDHVLLGKFNRMCPTKDDIALYFLPGDDESSTKNYHILSDFIKSRNMTMRSCLNDVELLIFTSEKLPADCQKMNSKFYLCGIFRSAKKHNPPERSQHKDKNCSLQNSCNSDADQLNHHSSPKPLEKSQHKDKKYSLCSNYDSDADRLKNHHSPTSGSSQHKEKNYSVCNNHDSDTDRLKHRPSARPSEKSQPRDMSCSLHNNYDSNADRLKHHPSPVPSEKSRYEDKNYSLCNNYDTCADDSMEIDMDIDMVGGKCVGRIDKVVSKSNCGEKKIQFENHKSSQESAQQPSPIKREQPEFDSPPGFSRQTTAAALLDAPPGFWKKSTHEAALLESPPPGFSKPVNDPTSSKRKRSCLNDALTREYFHVSTLQRQKHIQISDSSQNHQITDRSPQMQSASIDHKAAAEKERSSECTRDEVLHINRISSKVPKTEADCSDTVKLTIRFDNEVGGWKAH